MGLRDEIQADIGAAFDSDLSDAVGAFTLYFDEAGGYDPATGQPSSTRHTYTGRGVFGNYGQNEVDGQHIIATDIRLTALRNELVDINGSVATPKVGCLLVNEEGVNDWLRFFVQSYDDYRVVSVGKDPAGPTYTLQLRKA